MEKNPPSSAGDVRDTGSIPGLGRASEEGIIDRRTLELTKKRYSTLKDNGEAATRCYEGSNHNKIKFYTHWVGDPQTEQ